MSDDPKEELLVLVNEVFFRGSSAGHPLGKDEGWQDIEAEIKERMDQIETGGIVRAATAQCDGCSEGQTPTISATSKMWVHRVSTRMTSCDIAIVKEIRCEAQDVWTYLALRQKLRADAKAKGADNVG